MANQISVLITLRFNEEQLHRLRSVSPRFSIRQQSIHDDRDDVTAFLTGDEEIIYGMTPPRDLKKSPHLKWVQLHSAGINHLRNHPIWASPVQVTTGSGIHAVPIGEFAIGLMLALARKLPRVIRLQERTEWPRHKWNLMLGSELRGKTVGIVGYGNIGGEIARIAHDGFSMRVLAMRHDTNSPRLRYHERGVGDPEAVIPERWYSRPDLHSMLSESDFLILALPLTEESRNLIGEPELRAMRPQAFLINIARGELIDERALVHALKENWIAGAGLDAYAAEPLPRDSQLWHCENAIVSPHISGATPHYDDRAVELFAENLRRYVDAMPLLNVVDREKGY